MSATVLYMSMSLDGSSPGPTRDRTTGSATAGTACTSGSWTTPIEPGIEGIEGIRGVTFEDLLLITEDGSETLTDYLYDL